ncbi:MAG: phosphoribosyl-ATP diphosphatase [Oscillospiraceae bacterium]|nr:phosphoribosyl-ATP diphosphatase [Oscillospiraceae bacterium]
MNHTTDTLKDLYNVVLDRKTNPSENSYTCYLFSKGLDKILKKVGEECSETIIAAKNGKQEETVGEISDLIYHLMVMMVNEGIPLEAVTDELDRLSQKIGNLKVFHQTDHNS